MSSITFHTFTISYLLLFRASFVIFTYLLTNCGRRSKTSYSNQKRIIHQYFTYTIIEANIMAVRLYHCITPPTSPFPSPLTAKAKVWGGGKTRLRGRTIWFSSYCSLSSLVRSKVGGERWRGGNTIARSYRSACEILHF